MAAPPDEAASGQRKACGVLLFREQPERAFLLMKHPTRFDLPKGHVEPGESEQESALRELQEETGISAEDVELDRSFRFTTSYQVPVERNISEPIQKTVVIFLGKLKREVPLRLSEHMGFEWVPWRPPHHIQPETIDPLLAAVEQHWKGKRQN